MNGRQSPTNPPNGAITAPAQHQGDVDLIVIGGGVNGTGVLRDAALRGIRACLFERHDLAFGASGNSSGMIHGGVRYLTSNPAVTHLSCLDSGYIQRIAPHLLFRIPFLMPVASGAGSRVWLTLLDAFFGVYDRYQPLKRGMPHTRLSASDVRAIEPGLCGDLVGAVSFDEWGIDGARLCVANAVDAHERGAMVRTHTSVESIRASRDHPHLLQVQWRDMLTSRSGICSGKIVVNATGAWAPLTACCAKLAPATAPVRPGKGIHVVLDRRLSNYAIATRSIDARQVFLEPWQNVSLLGTTDTDYYGELDDVRASSDEVRYLIEALARVFPPIRQARAIDTLAAVRPTLYRYGPIPDKLSREHEILDHNNDGVDGMYSMIGGKLASYRIFAEQMTDIVARRLNNPRPCVTHQCPLPGGEQTIDERTLPMLDPVSARRLIYRHGTRARRIAKRFCDDSTTGKRRMLCPCEAITYEEAAYVIEHEFVRTVGDLSRRLRLGRGPCGGMHCVMQASALVAERLGMRHHDAITQGLRHLREGARRRSVAMTPQQVRQEQLLLDVLRSQLGLKDWHEEEACER